MVLACSQDPLFYINTFVWTYDPRRVPWSKLPFISYPFQDTGLLKLFGAIGDHDLLVEKSRDMGASWLCLLAIEWYWHFHSHLSFLLGSRVEDYVDKSDNPKSLFWKLDFLHFNLPRWLMPPGFVRSQHRQRMHLVNPATHSVIDGESTTGNFARGDRRTAIMLDEFAAVEQGHQVLSATRDATRSRIFNSTPMGTVNAYYDVRQTGIQKLRFHWSEHPEKNRGLYTTADDGSLRVLDPDNYPERHEPILDGKVRSPWYDDECRRAANEQEIAQELDIDYLGSGWQFFKASAVQDCLSEYARPPLETGDIEYDPVTAEPIRFRPDANGRLWLWCLLGREGRPPTGRTYVVACDVSAGTGASNSAAVVWDCDTAEKVAEYASPYIRPEEFARLSVSLATWFHGAHLIWEQNGPGRQFGARVQELGYSNIHYRMDGGKAAAIPGWASSKETKSALLGDYRYAIESKVCVNRSREALAECLEYVFDNASGVTHARSLNKNDPSGAAANHGDRVVADALAWMVLKGRNRVPEQPAIEVPYGSLAWRRQQAEEVKEIPHRQLGAGW